MPVIYSQNGLSIQVFTVGRVAIGANVTLNTDFTLDRPGRFLGANVSVDTADDTATSIRATVRTVTDTELTYGLALTQIRCALRPNAAITVGAKVVVFIGY